VAPAAKQRIFAILHHEGKIAYCRQAETKGTVAMSADAVMPVGIVVERRKTDHPWQDHDWRAIGVLAHFAPERWKLLAEGDGWAQFHAGTLNIELHRGETEGYLVNLSQKPPVVYVVLRPGEEEGDEDIEPFLATVCPYEAMSYEEGGEQIVTGVPMPPEVCAWVAEFVARYHVDVPFKKRRNRRHDDDGAMRLRGHRSEEAS
jgi:hypothetical protein